MLTVPHVAAGAALGSLFPETTAGVVAALGIGWASHYVLDRAPHWERLFGSKGSDFSPDAPLSRWPWLYVWHAGADVLIAFGLLALLLLGMGDLPHFWQSPIFWGGVGGFLPDFVDHVPIWNRTLHRLPLFKHEYAFHVKAHISPAAQNRAPKYAGLLTQLAVIVLAVWLLIGR